MDPTAASISPHLSLEAYSPMSLSACRSSSIICPGQAVINKISKAGSGPAAAKAATDAYQALSAAQKKDVYNLSALKEAQNKYAAALADAAKVEEHEQAVNTDHE